MSTHIFTLHQHNQLSSSHAWLSMRRPNGIRLKVDTGAANGLSEGGCLGAGKIDYE